MLAGEETSDASPPPASVAAAEGAEDSTTAVRSPSGKTVTFAESVQTSPDALGRVGETAPRGEERVEAATPERAASSGKARSPVRT